MTGESKVAKVTRERIGRINATGGMGRHSSLCYSASSTGKLALINNLIGVFETIISAEGYFTEKT